LADKYQTPSGTRIGHVHLKVSDLERALGFYHDLLGFQITSKIGNQAAFLSAGGYHHHIGLNTWQSEGMQPAAKKGVGLFHTAIVFPSRRDLAEIVNRVLEAGYPLTGAADHLVSEAIYLDDPDGNGVELYWDRPKETWTYEPDGTLRMATLRLDIEDLLGELTQPY
jgi:catechol 2,3-dioxygenase